MHFVSGASHPAPEIQKTDDLPVAPAPRIPTAQDIFEPAEPKTAQPRPELPQRTPANTSRLQRSWDYLKHAISGLGSLAMQGTRLFANAAMSMMQAAGESVTGFISRFTGKNQSNTEAAAAESEPALEALITDTDVGADASASKKTA